MSDRTPPGIKPGSDGRGFRAIIWVVIFAPFAAILIILGIVFILAAL